MIVQVCGASRSHDRAQIKLGRMDEKRKKTEEKLFQPTCFVISIRPVRMHLEKMKLKNGFHR
ncbi:Uncharacterized protein APZ42_013705 [Daphnia magna]|uniref:Uncharacterized protein n=1 Tax=Daphnia magna TaxID=35525 RepID=A0A0P6A6S1_9CRUS|nr:Uncharacterized protein APZ42_013705 [Daphnia magna]